MPEGLVQNLSDQELVDLLAYLGTLKVPSMTIGEWQVAGPFAPGVGNEPAEKGVDLKATYVGKKETKVGWRKLNADREGRLDLEAALGTRQAGVFLYTPVQSKMIQDGRLVVILPGEAKVTGWLNGKEVKFQPVKGTFDPQVGVPATAE